jgi:two-component system, cell cycle response regulator
MRVLIADDSKTFRGMLVGIIFDMGFDIVTAKTGSEALRILDNDDPPRLAILDWVMPGLTGTEICQKIRAIRNHPRTYIILLSSKNDKKDVVEGLDAGADDYLTKPFDVNELTARLHVGQRFIELNDKLHNLAIRDTLTELFNHGEILNILEKKFSECKVENSSLATLLVDLDHFKKINDQYGHLAGDIVLKEVSKRFSSLLKEGEAIGRYGGEEFLFVCPRCNVDKAKDRAEVILNTMRNTPVHVRDKEIPVNASIGIAVTNQNEDITTKQLVQSADEALYQAKEDGRNCFRISSGNHHAS